MRRFVHSFWTKPCENDNEKLKKYILYFATSLAWLKKNNFPIVLHTDSKGKELFKNLPYDEIYTTLDNTDKIEKVLTMENIKADAKNFTNTMTLLNTTGLELTNR